MGLYSLGSRANTSAFTTQVAVSNAGDVMIGSTTGTFKLNVGGSFNATGYNLNGASIDLSSITGVSAGTASASKALILNASKNITGINSLSTTDFLMNGSVQEILGINWYTTSSTTLVNGNSWYGSCWSPEMSMFVAVGGGTTTRLMTSTDGISRTGQSTPSSGTWTSICWAPEIMTFTAVGNATNSILSSSNGTSWSSTTPPSSLSCQSVCWSPELKRFVAVNYSTTTYATYRNYNGSWTNSSASASIGYWRSVCWSPALNLFVAVGDTASSGCYVITSSDGITWTYAIASEAGAWCSVCWSPDLSIFVAVSQGTSTNRIMTSSNGTTWTGRSATGTLRSVQWVPELSLFIASGDTTVLTSPDGITWTSRSSATSSRTSVWAPELATFITLDDNGTTRGYYSKHATNSNMINMVKSKYQYIWRQYRYGYDT